MNPTDTDFSILHAFWQGGWVMVPLFACSLVAVAVIIERLGWGLRRSRVIPPELVREIEHLRGHEGIDVLNSRIRDQHSALGRLVFTCLQNIDRSRTELTDLLEVAGRRESAALQRYIGILGTIAAIAPLLGLLGTVVGIIRTFALIEQHGIGNPQMLAGGISEALVATATGITVAVPSVIFYRVLLHRSRQLSLDLESFSLLLLRQLGKGGPSGALSEIPSRATRT